MFSLTRDSFFLVQERLVSSASREGVESLDGLAVSCTASSRLAGGNGAIGSREARTIAVDGVGGVVDNERDLVTGTIAVRKLNPPSALLGGDIDVIVELEEGRRVWVNLGIVVDDIGLRRNRFERRQIFPLLLGVREATTGQMLPLAAANAILFGVSATCFRIAAVDGVGRSFREALVIGDGKCRLNGAFGLLSDLMLVGRDTSTNKIVYRHASTH